ncbi:MAG: hypothetical protein HY817_02140 [Candidatus Abawacabacteria bacterium]|nr:hypothetical protein [Candidatus Abawacabacteria bacterium]
MTSRLQEGGPEDHDGFTVLEEVGYAEGEFPDHGEAEARARAAALTGGAIDTANTMHTPDQTVKQSPLDENVATAILEKAARDRSADAIDATLVQTADATAHPDVTWSTLARQNIRDGSWLNGTPDALAERILAVESEGPARRPDDALDATSIETPYHQAHPEAPWYEVAMQNERDSSSQKPPQPAQYTLPALATTIDRQPSLTPTQRRVRVALALLLGIAGTGLIAKSCADTADRIGVPIIDAIERNR